MRINIHDFSGHPFQIQLSRELARRGHDVEHTYCSDYVTGRGRLTVQPDDPATLMITPLSTGLHFDKYSPTARLRFEVAYGRAWREFLRSRSFDAVISCNLPLISQALAQRALARSRTPWVFWHQDIYSAGMISELRRKIPRLAGPLGAIVERLEKRQVRTADHVVAIGTAFVAKYEQWGSPISHVSVIPNWAPLEDLRPVERDNAWAAEHRLPTSPIRLLYSGTLGRKHNPMLLLHLLDRLKERGLETALVVCSEGVGAEDIKRAAVDRDDVHVLGFQPAELFDQVLSSADVVVALLESDASTFSVPSKVLSYLAAGRPVVGLMPSSNPAVHDIVSAGGYTAEPGQTGVAASADWIKQAVQTQGLLPWLITHARSYAESQFDITRIGDRFEAILDDVAATRRPPARVPARSSQSW